MLSPSPDLPGKLGPLVVGGTFNLEGGKGSGVVVKLAALMLATSVNGGTPAKLKGAMNLRGYSPILWLPDIPNEEAKHYPVKDPGAILICSKVMREGYTTFDSVSRIFKMHGNAVIEIRKTEAKHYTFRLVDALGNVWVDTSDLAALVEAIWQLVAWTQNAKRVRTQQVDMSVPPVDLEPLAEVSRFVADRVENERGGRFFGNASTRCMAMFPSQRSATGAFVSLRNIDKTRISAGDFTLTVLDDSGISYVGTRKPSVDAPVQLELFRRFPRVNYMVHGHAFINGAPETNEYFPCGDLREVDDVSSLMEIGSKGCINLKKHGFLMYAETVEDLRDLAASVRYINVAPPPGR